MATPGEEYVVVARRYRPQSFVDLVGQGQVSTALGNAINTNRVGHAYLFTGARGVGKTSTARIFAKALDCVNGPTTAPCGECDICRGIAAGEDVDVLEIDGASNRGIDEIRQLRSNVNVRPSRARFKIYIIDEVHMLTTPAFNALLKTLEEPPEHVKFIFCTTEADKIPITVLSRCQRFDFAPIEAGSILERLQLICEREGVQAETEALQVLARRAAGSMRDSQSLLEQLLSFGGNAITLDNVHAMLGTAATGRLAALAQCVVDRDAAEALNQLNAAVNEGIDLGQLTEQLLGYFRDTMAAVVGCPVDLLLHCSPSDFPALSQFGRQLGLETLLAIVQILDQTLSRLRQSTHVRTLVEIALIRLCRLEDLDQLSQLVAQLGGAQPTATNRSAPGAATRPALQRPQPAVVNVPPKIDAAAQRTEPSVPPPASRTEPAAPQKKNLEAEEAASTQRPSPGLAPLSSAEVGQLWQQTLAELGDMTADFARQSDPVTFTPPDRIIARFRQKAPAAFCERPDKKAKLEEVLSRLSGRPLRLEIVVQADAPTAAGSNTPPRQAPTTSNRRKRMRDAERSPIVRQAIELFDAEIVDVIEPVVEEPSEVVIAAVDEV